MARAEEPPLRTAAEREVGSLVRTGPLDREHGIAVADDEKLPSRGLHGEDRPPQRCGDRTNSDPAGTGPLLQSRRSRAGGTRDVRLGVRLAQAAIAWGRMEAVASW